MYFRCLGSTQHLKNKYGSGYVLVVKCVLEEEDWKKVEDDIFEIFDENKTMLDESFADRRIYSVLQDAVKSLGDVFAALEKCKKNHWLHICCISAANLLHICCMFAAYLLHICCISAAYQINKSSFLFSLVKHDHNIEEYSFSQTTLEQVFIRFAKDQEIEDEEVSSKL